MAVIVQKYGGTSVGSLKLIEAVAENIIKTRQQGHQVVAVLSAMSGETNRLLSMAHSLDKQPSSRELDMLLATGEQTTIALLAIALIKRGYSAVSLLAHQVGILTDNHFGCARIQKVEIKRLVQSLEQEQIVLIAGFQGVDIENNITTLGRGGSDTSAVAVAAALGARECQIFTDVEGIYSADPRIESQARKLEYIAFDEMLVMASLGAKVLHHRAVEYAMHYNLPIRVLSSFTGGNGTQVINRNSTELANNNAIISSISHQQKEILISLSQLKSIDDIVNILQLLGSENIEIDMLNQNIISQDNISLNFTIHQDEQVKVQALLSDKLGLAVNINEKVAKLSVIGMGIKSHSALIGELLKVLCKENISIHLISTSEIHISVIINEADLNKGVHVLHRAYHLNLAD